MCRLSSICGGNLPLSEEIFKWSLVGGAATDLSPLFLQRSISRIWINWRLLKKLTGDYLRIFISYKSRWRPAQRSGKIPPVFLNIFEFIGIQEILKIVISLPTTTTDMGPQCPWRRVRARRRATEWLGLARLGSPKVRWTSSNFHYKSRAAAKALASNKKANKQATHCCLTFIYENLKVFPSPCSFGAPMPNNVLGPPAQVNTHPLSVDEWLSRFLWVWRRRSERPEMWNTFWPIFLQQKLCIFYS